MSLRKPPAIAPTLFKRDAVLAGRIGHALAEATVFYRMFRTLAFASPYLLTTLLRVFVSGIATVFTATAGRKAMSLVALVGFR